MPPSFINMTSKERRKKALKVKHNQFNHTSKKREKFYSYIPLNPRRINPTSLDGCEE